MARSANEIAKQRFQAQMPRMRREFAERCADFSRDPKSFGHDYPRRFPETLIRYAENETARRIELAARCLTEAFRAEPRQRSEAEVQSALADCFQHTDEDHNPFSDVKAIAESAFGHVAQVAPDGERSPSLRIAYVQLHSSQEAVAEIMAMQSERPDITTIVNHGPIGVQQVGDHNSATVESQSFDLRSVEAVLSKLEDKSMEIDEAHREEYRELLQGGREEVRSPAPRAGRMKAILRGLGRIATECGSEVVKVLVDSGLHHLVT